MFTTWQTISIDGMKLMNDKTPIQRHFNAVLTLFYAILCCFNAVLTLFGVAGRLLSGSLDGSVRLWEIETG